MATRTSRPPPARPAATLDPSARIEALLRHGLRLADAAQAFARSLDVDDLGDIDLPPQHASAADQANVRAAASLYLAAELESARVLPAVEMLAGLFVSGGLAQDLGPAAELLVQFWRQRKERFSPEERRGFFARIFGHSDGPPLAATVASNEDFEPLCIDFAESLYRLLDVPLGGSGSFPSPGTQTRIRTAANNLAANLAEHASGLGALAARDVLATIQVALRILKFPETQHAVGANSVWSAIRSIGNRYLEDVPQISPHLQRGQSGMVLLAWLADALPNLEAGTGPLVAPQNPVVEAAAAWLESSLSLYESKAGPPAPTTAG